MACLADLITSSDWPGISNSSLQQAKICQSVEYYGHRCSAINNPFVKHMFQYLIIMNILFLMHIVENLMESLFRHFPEKYKKILLLYVIQQYSDVRPDQKL